MPFPVAAAIAGGSALAGGAIQAASTARQNRLSRDFSREMYDKQYRDSIALWTRQNDYNSPQAQMQRFKAAGLNPNLIYGQGNSGNAGSIPTPDVQAAQFRVPEIGNAVSAAGSEIAQYIDYEIKLAQLDNFKTQNTVLEEEAVLKRAQALSLGTGAARTQFDLDFETEMRPVSADARREQLRKTKAEADLILNNDERAAAMNAQTITESIERVLNLKAQRAVTKQDEIRIRTQIEGVRKDNRLKQFDIELKRLGIQPGDPLWMRLVAQYIAGGKLNPFKN